MKQLLNIFSIDYYLRFFKKIRLFFETDLFDILNGIDTSRVSKSELFGENSDFEYCNLHVPTFTSRIKLALKTLIKLNEGVLNFNFIDLGSGKGKVLILAHKMGFKKIFGVEISSNLNKICKKNLKKMKIYNVEVLEQDASTLKILPENSVFYFYNSFEKQILDKVLDNIYQSLKKQKKKCYIICIDLKSLVDYKKFQLDDKKFKLKYNNDAGSNPFSIYEINF